MNNHKLQPFVRLDSLKKVFNINGEEFLAVQDFSLNVMEGELVSIVGPSGCGKSTVLSMLADLFEPSDGAIEIGNELQPFYPGRDIGMVFQKPLLLKWRTIFDNVLLPAEILGLPVNESRDRANDLINMVGLNDFKNAYPGQLSGGMQQRASIARALIHDPSLILMDEPFGALDALTRERMNLELLRIWKESGKTILFVTHGIQEAVFLGSQVAVMTSGPARMADQFKVKLPEPRNLAIKSTKEFGEYTRRIYKLLGMN
tara:strand:- start:2222 stop:2998 length:777 start_codon:yes stop_codon:yes gene_type:complete